MTFLRIEGYVWLLIAVAALLLSDSDALFVGALVISSVSFTGSIIVRELKSVPDFEEVKK